MDGQVAAIRVGARRRRVRPRRRSWPTPPSTHRRSTARSARPPTARPSFGDRRAYQMDPANGREALREMELDVAEGADMLLVKPALPGLDLIAAARARFDLPIAAYQVSGEYAMLTAAAERGWLDGQRAMTESVTAIVRAGAGHRHHLRRRRPRHLAAGRAMSADAEASVPQTLHPGPGPAPRSGLASADRRRAARRRPPLLRGGERGGRRRGPEHQLFLGRPRARHRPPALADGAVGRCARSRRRPPAALRASAAG